MKRNMEAIVNKALIPECYNLKLEELYRILYMPIFYAINKAYTYGFALGQRYEKNNTRKMAKTRILSDNK